MPKRILIVDDEDAVRHVVRRALEERGHEVHEATDGHQAIGRLTTAPFDLVILDILMPRQDGLETILKIREEGLEMPFMAVSAPTNHMFLRIARQLGAVATLEKPFDITTLRELVDEAVSSDPAGRR